MRIDPQEWRDVPGFGGQYQANAEGQIRRIWPDGRTSILKPCQHDQQSKRGVTTVVNMYCQDGKRRLKCVGRIIAETFMGPTPPGMVIYHKNGMLTDNSLYNLDYIGRGELCKRLGSRSHERPVVKLSGSGDIIAAYGSAKKAAEANYISYSVMLWRCNGGPRTGPASDGCDYAWEDDPVSIRAARRRLAYIPKYKQKGR